MAHIKTDEMEGQEGQTEKDEEKGEEKEEEKEEEKDEEKVNCHRYTVYIIERIRSI